VDGQVPVQVRVQAPTWVEVNRLRAFAGRDVVLDMPLPATGTALRYGGVLEVPLDGAPFVLVRADGDRQPEPMFDEPPLGVTNPLLVGP
jgi:hypothetical protein